MRISRTVAAAALVAALVAPAGARAAGWSPPFTLAGDAAGTPRIAMTRGGEAIVGWGSKLDAGAPVQVAIRPGGGSFGTPQTLSESTFYFDQLVANASGDATAVWSEGPPWDVHSFFASRPAGGTFEPAVAWPLGGRIDVAAVAPDGSTLFAYHDAAGASKVVRRTAAGFGEPRQIATGILYAAAAVDEEGRLVLVSTARPPGESWGAVFVTTGTPEAGFSEPHRLSSPDRPLAPANPSVRLAMNAHGDAVAAWTALPPGETYPYSDADFDAAMRPGRGDWGPAETVLESRAARSAHDVAIDDAGNAILVAGGWFPPFDRPRNELGLVYRAAGGAWTRERVRFNPACCSGAPGFHGAWSPSAAFDAHGNAVVLFTDRLDGSVLRAAVRPRDGELGPFETLAEPAGNVFDPAVATDGSGHALAVWSTKEHTDRSDSGINRVRAAFYAPATPTVTRFRALRRGALGFAYRATNPARVTVRVDAVRRGHRATRVATLTRKRFARSGRLPLRRRLVEGRRYRATLRATSRQARAGLPRRIAFRG